MDPVASALKHILMSERLTVITVVLTIAGLICFFSERYEYWDFAGLPVWSRPAAQVVWIVCAVHVVVRALMGLGKLCRAILHRAISLPERYRRSRFERPTIARLRGTDGLQREALAFALHRDESRFWVERDRQYRWLAALRQKGLVEEEPGSGLSSNALFQIHPIVWRYMKSHPNQFVYRWPWIREPWSEVYDETKLEEKLKK